MPLSHLFKRRKTCCSGLRLPEHHCQSSPPPPSAAQPPASKLLLPEASMVSTVLTSLVANCSSGTYGKDE